MGEHRPEAAQRRRRNPDAEARNVTLEERAGEILPPGGAIFLRGGEKGARKGASSPEPPDILRPDLVHVETVHVDELDPPGKGFGRLPDQLRRRTAQAEEARRERTAIGEHPQDLQVLRPVLDLVDHHQPFETLEHQLGILQPGEVGGGFEIEKGRRMRLHQPPSEGGFAALPGPQERRDRVALEGLADGRKEGGSSYHPSSLL